MRWCLTVVAVLLVSGCWMRAERQMAERVETMETHLQAWFDGADAAVEGDDPEVVAALKRLEKGGELPGHDLDEPLEALHREARGLRKASPADRARGLVKLSARCAVCHTAQGHRTPTRFTPDSSLQRVLAALVWEDEAAWSRGAAELRGQQWAVPESGDWASRREALAEAVAARAGGAPPQDR